MPNERVVKESVDETASLFTKEFQGVVYFCQRLERLIELG